MLSARLLFAAALLQLLCFATPRSVADEPEVVEVRTEREPGGTWRFDVTLRHADEGWDHYADKWEILTLDGEVIATRTLLHPHVDEQPFTRSLGGVEISSELSEVRVRGHDKVHGYGSVEITIEFPQ